VRKLGIDIGSTTLKCVLLSERGEPLFKKYERHYSKIAETLDRALCELEMICGPEEVETAVSGSAGMGIADAADLPFVQEVYAEQIAVKRVCPGADVVIELGGEDAKILFLTGGFEMRMNGTCAGGTGSFIDQMASLMNVTPDEMNELASRAEKTYTVASRCGVFAKSDVQPLLNQGAKKEDVSASIFRAVVNQTVGGLAQGREFKGNIVYLGGPLTFLPELRRSFDDALGTEGVCPDGSLYFVAAGAALAGVGKKIALPALRSAFAEAAGNGVYQSLSPLFSSEEEYEEFRSSHAAASEGIRELDAPADVMYLGIDAGSTTVKAVLCDGEGNVFMPYYTQNNGNPVPIIREYLSGVYAACPDVSIRSCAVTGYGEEIVRNAFGVDFGVVETVAHYTAAKRFRPDVDFILDIGGQDIKCFRIRNGAIDNIYLNEACSSGCGSFLQTFAAALGFSAAEFAEKALYAKNPVDLGSRCTVFMNSSVKQAQKDGASVEDIAAGLSVSVVKNALYKVIRCAAPDQLGENIVVQGGTFLSDAVLRAFEKELGREVIRPKLAPIMGAYGAALYSMEHCGSGTSSLITKEGLASFTHEVRAVTCKGCGNHCSLTVNTFDGKRRFIAGNRCDKPLSSAQKGEKLDMYEYKRELLEAYCSNIREPGKPTVGIPLGLNVYELLPLWHTFFKNMGFNVIVSPFSTRETFTLGQHTIPSDTVCYPAKLMHGHVEKLLDRHPDAIFYPDMTYNTDEKTGVNHFNCPVVAYYPQVLKLNVARLKETKFICDFIGVASRRHFVRRMKEILPAYFPDTDLSKIPRAAKKAYAEYRAHMARISAKTDEYMRIAREKGMPVILLAGRPYHADPEINHGISALICKLGAAVITEDGVCGRVKRFPVAVRNQWTYHARLYSAAKYVASASADVNLVQLVSFGCGVDAITSDETRSIIEEGGKIYTQIKIDEISNMGAVNIRLRSLFSAVEDRTAKASLS